MVRTDPNIDGGKPFDWGRAAADYARYRDTGKARVFTLTASALEEFFGSSGPVVHSPSHGPFFTAKGGVIDAPLIKTH